MKEKFDKSIELLEEYLSNISDDEFKKDWEEISLSENDYGELTIDDFINVHEKPNSILLLLSNDTHKNKNNSKKVSAFINSFHGLLHSSFSNRRSGLDIKQFTISSNVNSNKLSHKQSLKNVSYA